MHCDGPVDIPDQGDIGPLLAQCLAFSLVIPTGTTVANRDVRTADQ